MGHRSLENRDETTEPAPNAPTTPLKARKSLTLRPATLEPAPTHALTASPTSPTNPQFTPKNTSHLDQGSWTI